MRKNFLQHLIVPKKFQIYFFIPESILGSLNESTLHIFCYQWLWPLQLFDCFKNKNLTINNIPFLAVSFDDTLEVLAFGVLALFTTVFFAFFTWGWYVTESLPFALVTGLRIDFGILPGKVFSKAFSACVL